MLYGRQVRRRSSLPFLTTQAVLFPLCRRAEFAAKLEALGIEHKETQRAGRVLARALKKCGKIDESIELYQRVLRAETDLLGEGHTDVLSTAFNLAVVLHTSGRRDEAETLYLSQIE